MHVIGKTILITLIVLFIVHSITSVFEGYFYQKLCQSSSNTTVGLYLNISRSGQVLNHAGGPRVSTLCYSLIYFKVNGTFYEAGTNYLDLPYGYSLNVIYNKYCPEINQVVIPDSIKKYQCERDDCIICYNREIGKSPDNYIKNGSALYFNWIYLFYK